jgi:hypothetical protein
MHEMQEAEKVVSMKNCINGCEKPVAKPSIVICKDCQEKITERLKKMLEKMVREERNAKGE